MESNFTKFEIQSNHNKSKKQKFFLEECHIFDILKDFFRLMC